MLHSQGLCSVFFFFFIVFVLKKKKVIEEKRLEKFLQPHFHYQEVNGGRTLKYS